MNKHSMIFIGLDTHKEFHEVAYYEEQRGASPVHYGRIPSSKVSVKKLIRQFESNNSEAALRVSVPASALSGLLGRADKLAMAINKAL